MLSSVGQIFEYIRIFEYKYWIYDFSNIFVFIFGQKLSFAKGKYSNIFRYSNICLQILDLREINIRPTLMLKMFVRHGMVTYFILVCTLLPLVKNNLADITTSENCRAMASDSLILKLLDIEILLLEGDKLDCDELQFGFQANSRTSMCTWTAREGLQTGYWCLDLLSGQEEDAIFLCTFRAGMEKRYSS